METLGDLVAVLALTGVLAVITGILAFYVWSNRSPIRARLEVAWMLFELVMRLLLVAVVVAGIMGLLLFGIRQLK
jgi:hypothetical protein